MLFEGNLLRVFEKEFGSVELPRKFKRLPIIILVRSFFAVLTCTSSKNFQLLEHVRLASCHPKFLVGTVSEDPLVMNDATCRHLLDEAKNSQLLRLSTYGPLELQGRKSRKSFETGEVLYVGMASYC
ncbi:hypothetical protein COOONC_18722, partial [Cooperia oncophora]